MTTLRFLGAANTVTGSRFLVDGDGRRVLVDCGLFQGLKALRLKNRAPFPVEPASLDAVLLTHAHLDHSGALPILARDGLRAPVHATAATIDLAAILLADAARLEEEQAAWANEKKWSKHAPALPLFTVDDAARAQALFRAAPYGDDVAPAPGVVARFFPAGHILGAASIRLSIGGTSVLFSGDLGRDDDPVVAPPATPEAADHVVVESTYGGVVRGDADPRAQLADAVSRTCARGGVVMIPSFAVGRAQAVLLLLQELMAAGRIPTVPVFLNSPMASSVGAVTCRHPAHRRLTQAQCEAMCTFPRVVETAADSRALNGMRGPLIVVAGSGMATGGRILHHLRAWAGDSRNTILLVGFQAAGTRGAALAAGARVLRVHGADVAIRADVVRVDGLSAHADEDGVVAWLRSLSRAPRRVFVVHGEPTAADAMRARIERELGWSVVVPALGEEAVLS